MSRLVNHIEKQYPHALSLTGDPDNAMDLLQDLSVKVFSNAGYYDDKTGEDIDRLMSFWLRKIHINRWRRLNNTSYGNYSDMTTMVSEEKVRHKLSVENDAWGRLQKQELQKAFLKLTHKDMPVYFRLKLDGYRNKDIAEILNTSENILNQRRIRSSAQLRKILSQ